VATVADVTSEPKPFNPFEPGFAEDPYPQYAELFYSFDAGPVHFVVLDDAWIADPGIRPPRVSIPRFRPLGWGPAPEP